jgi:effector-binding domain-containing protein
VDGDSRYRYYSLAQANEVERIRQLRSLEIPLDEIRQALTAETPSAMRPIFERHRRRIEGQLEETKRILGAMDALMSNEEALMTMEVIVKKVVKQSVLTIRTRTSLAAIGDAIHASLGKLYGYLDDVGAAPVGPPLTVYFDDDIEKEEDVEIGVCVPVERALAGRGEIASDTLQAGVVACAIHAGAFESLPAAYPRLLSWIDKNGYQIAGPARETYLAKRDAPAENRTEIMWPVRRVDHR